jgi:hypothetical protein
MARSQEDIDLFVAQHRMVQHQITLPMTVDEAFMLFTPEGERLWIADWNPHYFHPANGETLEGMVFSTGHDAETTYWTLVDFDIAAHVVRYSRVTPSSRSCVVTVRCSTLSDSEASVVVAYDLTGLSEAGNDVIEAFASGFAAMIEGWRDSILAYAERVKVRIST